MNHALKLAAEFNRYFTSSNGVDVPERVSISRDEWRQLHAALHAYGHATQPAEVTRDEVMQAAKEATAPEWQDVVDGWHMGLDLMAFARAILALHPQASPDGRGTDAQILKEREIARHAIDGAIAAGYAGATHPGADHWLAAAHNAGMRIAELERAMTPVPCNTFLVRDVAELLGCSVPDVCTAFVQLGRGNRSTNMAITPDEALSVARHLALRPAQVPMTDGYGDDDCGWTFAIARELEAQEKRLMSLLVKAFGSRHPAIDDMAHLILTRPAHHGIPAPAGGEG